MDGIRYWFDWFCRVWSSGWGDKHMQFTEKTRRLIRERAQDRCELCGTPVQDAQIHHRRPRGMGGTKNPESRSAANGMYVHLRCHQRIELNRADALRKGWLILQSGDLSQPIRLHHGWAVLHEDGSYDALGEKYQSPHQGSDGQEDSIPPFVPSTSE